LSGPALIKVDLQITRLKRDQRRAAVHDHAHATAVGMVGWIEPTNRP
jgi:hypothetical protein